MAERGMRFTDFYVASSVCSPSRAALMTGSYPKRIGLASGVEFGVLLPGDPIGLHPDEITIASLLKSAGYATKLVGKWHLGDQPPFLPTRHGFDSYFGLPYSNDHYLGRPREQRERHPAPFREHGFPPLPLMCNEDVFEEEPDQATLTERYAQEAVKFIETHKDQPFFLYLAHMYVHTPLHPPKGFLAKSQNGPYGAEVEYIDFTTGIILDTLKDLALDRRTLVIFTSDNGSTGRDGGSNAPLRGTKGTTWEGGMREPCVMYWPGRIPGRTVCSEICSTMDVLPTIAYLAGCELPSDRVIDGIDIHSLMFNESTSPRGRETLFYYGSNTLFAVRAGDWKLFVTEEPRLFNLREDISETKNLYGKHPEITARLTEYAQACRHDIGDKSLGIEGQNCRDVGRVNNPKTLTSFPGDQPYIQAAYD